jgi:hypothetical protein
MRIMMSLTHLLMLLMKLKQMSLTCIEVEEPQLETEGGVCPSTRKRHLPEEIDVPDVFYFI